MLLSHRNVPLLTDTNTATRSRNWKEEHFRYMPNTKSNNGQWKENLSLLCGPTTKMKLRQICKIQECHSESCHSKYVDFTLAFRQQFPSGDIVQTQLSAKLKGVRNKYRIVFTHHQDTCKHHSSQQTLASHTHHYITSHMLHVTCGKTIECEQYLRKKRKQIFYSTWSNICNSLIRTC